MDFDRKKLRGKQFYLEVNTMKNKFFSKVTSLILAACCVFGAISPLNAFAMEYDDDTADASVSSTAEDIMPLAGNDIFNYADVKEVGGFAFSGTNLTPVKTVGNDPRMHRLIFKIQIGRMNPTVLRPVQLRFSVRNAYGSTIASTDWITVSQNMVISNNPDFNGPAEHKINVPVSQNQQIQFYFEARYDAPEGDRYHDAVADITIENYWIYCD